jgi:WD40 repeat protein
MWKFLVPCFIYIFSYPDLELQHILKAHPGTCICIEFDPTGRYFATGSADALVSLWDVDELACLRTFSRWEGMLHLKVNILKKYTFKLRSSGCDTT